MSKHYTKSRSKQFDRIPQDAYDTPLSASWPLFSHLPKNAHFAEPCAGRGQLVRHLENNGFKCAYAGDVKPRAVGIQTRDALSFTPAMFKRARAQVIITNPPWKHELCAPLVTHFMKLGPTWLLLDADWMHNQRTAEMLDRCAKVVSIGRVKWIENSRSTGFDNCCWYYFPMHHRGGPTIIGR